MADIPAVQQMPGISIVAPPEESWRQTVTGPQRTTKYKDPNEAVLAARAEQMKREREAREAAEREQEAKQEAAKAEAQAAEQAEATARAAEAERIRIRAEREQGIRARMATAEQKRKEMEKSAKITTYWEDRSAPARVVSAFLVGLGEYAARMGGGENTAYKVLSDEMARDRQAKIDKYTQSKEFYELSRNDAEAAQRALAAHLKDISDSEETRQKLINRQLEAITKRVGTPQAQAAYEKLQSQSMADQAGRRAKEASEYDRELTEKEAEKSQTHTLNKGGTQQPDLTVTDESGKPRAIARSKEHAAELSAKTAALSASREIVANLKKLNEQKAQRTLGRFRPDFDLDGAIATEQKNLLEKKKVLYGALNATDEETFKDKVSMSMARGPKAAAKALDAVLGGMEVDLEASVKTQAVPLTQAQSGAAPVKSSPGKRKPVETREVGGKRYIRKGGDWFAVD